MVISAADTEALESVIDDLNGEFAPPAAGVSEDFCFDSSSTTEEDIRSDGFIDIEGFYHLEISKVELNLSLLTAEGAEQTPHIKVYMKVLQSVPGQSPAGSILSHQIYVASKGGEPAKKGSIDSMYRFGIGIGLLKWSNVGGKVVPVLASNNSTKIPVSAWNTAVGLQTIAKVTKEKGNNRGGSNQQQGQDGEPQGKTYADRFVIQMGRCHRPDDPEYSHVPKNVEAMKALGMTAPPMPQKAGVAAYQRTAAGAGAGAAKPATTTAPSSSPSPAVSQTATAPAGKEEGGLFDDF